MICMIPETFRELALRSSSEVVLRVRALALEAPDAPESRPQILFRADTPMFSACCVETWVP